MTVTQPETARPLAQLYLHELNPRQSVTEAEIEDLATCLEINGLLQNLVGLREGQARRVGIVGGGRRLRALQLLAAQNRPLGGETDWQDAVPVKVTRDPDQALRWAGTENEARAPLHPADEVRLYRGLRDRSLTPGAIARAHSVTELHVRRRLSLAGLPDPAIEALRAGEITLDIAQALTLGRSEAAVLSILEQVRGRDITAETVRRQLTAEAVRGTDRRAVFVGLDAYEAAGGTLTRDLFTENHALHDVDLLDRLFAEKLDAAADEVQAAEGWAEVRTLPDDYLPHGTSDALHRLRPEPVTLPEADADELERLHESDPESWTADEVARFEELTARARGDYTDDQRAAGIVFVLVDRLGRLQVERAWTAARPGRPGTRTDGDSDAPAAASPETPGLSQALRDDLAAIRTAALQAALVAPDRLDLVLAIATHELTVKGYARAMGLTLSHPPTRPTQDDALDLPEEVTETPIAGLGHDPDPEALRRMLAGPQGFLHPLQLALARAVQARPDAWGRALMEAAGADIRRHWRPTAVNFFGRCPGGYLDAVYAAILPDSDPAGFHALKKAEKAATLDRLFRLEPETIVAWGLDEAAQARIAQWLPEEIMP